MKLVKSPLPLQSLLSALMPLSTELQWDVVEIPYKLGQPFKTLTQHQWSSMVFT